VQKKIQEEGEEQVTRPRKQVGKKGYDHNPDFMRAAWDLYMQGMGATGIAERLRDDYPGLCRQSVSRVINKYGWEKQRARYLELKIEGVEEQRLILADLKGAYEKLKEIIQGPEPNHQHFAQFLKAIEQIREIEGWDSRSGGEGVVLSTDQEMNAYLEALQEDDVLGAMMKKRRREIKRRYEEILKRRGLNDEKDEKDLNG